MPKITRIGWGIAVVIAFAAVAGGCYGAIDLVATKAKAAKVTGGDVVAVAALIVLALAGLFGLYHAISKLWDCDDSGQPRQTSGKAPLEQSFDYVANHTLHIVVVGAGVLVFATFFWAGGFVAFQHDHSEVALPVVIIAGLVVLVMVLGLLTFVFSVLKLTDSKEALGLPSGSIRAVIALMLLVVFAIVAIFLYSDVSTSGRLQKIERVSPAQEIELRKQLEVVVVVPETRTVDVPKSENTPATKQEEKTGLSTVYYRGASRAAEDLAKQLIVLLGTLVTAVSSFYFGSSSIAAVTKPPESSGGPNAKAVDPGSLKSGVAKQPVRITGTNLGNVATVKLTLIGEQDIPADAGSIVVGTTSVDCRFTIKKETKPGSWTVTVSDNANNDSNLPGAMTIETKPPSPASIELAGEVKVGGAAQTLTVKGTDLDNVNKVELRAEGKDTIAAAAVTPASEKVVCTVTAPAGSAGVYKVFVVDTESRAVPVSSSTVTIA